jgi:hypothetical protein
MAESAVWGGAADHDPNIGAVAVSSSLRREQSDLRSSLLSFVMSFGSFGRGAGCGVMYLSSGFRVDGSKSVTSETEEDLLLLTKRFSKGTSSTFKYWPGRSGHELVDGWFGS